MDTNQYQNLMSQSKFKMWIWIAIVVIAVAGVVIYYFYFATGFPRTPGGEGLSSGQSATDETVAIEKDLNTIDLNGLDSELDDIQKELAK